PSNPFSEATRFSPARKPAPAPAPSVSVTRRDAELLDRKRNWIFLTPENVSKTQSVEEVFGVEGFLGEKKSRGVVSQFLKSDQDASLELQNEQNEFSRAPEIEIAPRNENPLTTQRNLDPIWQKKVS